MKIQRINSFDILENKNKKGWEYFLKKQNENSAYKHSKKDITLPMDE